MSLHPPRFLLTVLLMLILASVQGQNWDKKELKELYPKKYTFEKADEFVARNEWNKALWFYINLYPQYPEKTVDAVRRLQGRIDDLRMQIKKSYALYGVLKFNKKGEPSIDLASVMQTAHWGDSLVAAVDGPQAEKDSCYCRLFRTGKFRYLGDYEGVSITRDTAYQVETDGHLYMKLKIHWVNDCEYILTYLDLNLKNNRNLIGKTLYVVMYQTTPFGYMFMSEIGGKIIQGEIEKVEEDN